MKKILLILLFVLLLVLLQELRYTVFHFPVVMFNALRDWRFNSKYKKYNEFKDFGRIDIYIACDGQPFGSGKTLNMVKRAFQIYRQYNNRLIWSEEKQQFIRQHIRILSNLTLKHIPYVPLVSEQQIIHAADHPEDGVVTLVLIDEMASQFNNRDWKINLSSDLLEAILQQRKSKIAILGTVQNYSLYDATLRKLTSRLYVCKKIWRFLKVKSYFACDYDRAQGNLALVTSCGSSVGFATDLLYHSYDTTEKIKKLSNDVKNGLMLTNEEILTAANGESVSLESLTRIRRRYRKRVKR